MSEYALRPEQIAALNRLGTSLGREKIHTLLSEARRLTADKFSEISKYNKLAAKLGLHDCFNNPFGTH